MKNYFHLATLLTIFGLSSCTLEAPEIPTDEIYLRNFIKEFGLIDPDQDWSMAKSAEVTVTPNGHANRVKVYGKQFNTYYLVANITDVNQQISIPLDLPKPVTDLKVVIDGEDYYTKVGGSVDATKPSSRSFIYDGKSEDDAVTLGTGTTVTDAQPVAIQDGSVDGSHSSILKLPVNQAKAFFTTVPEGGPIQGTSGFPGNLTNPALKTDFLLTGTGQPIVIYPVYWHTIQSHELGVYYFTTEDQSQQNVNTLVRVPFYKMQKPPEYEDYTLERTNTTTTTTTTTEEQWMDVPIKFMAQDMNYVPHDISVVDNQYTIRRNRSYGSVNGVANQSGYRTVIITTQDGSTFKTGDKLRISLAYASSTAVTTALHTNKDAVQLVDNNSPIGSSLNFTQNWKEFGSEGAQYIEYTVESKFNDFNAIIIDIPAPAEPASAADPDNYYDLRFYAPKTSIKKYVAAGTVTTSNTETTSNYRYQTTYRPANAASWTQQVTVIDINKDGNTGTETSRTTNTYQNTVNNPGMQNSHLLLEIDGVTCCPLADEPQWPHRTTAYHDALANNPNAYVLSKGISITIKEGLKYGFYIHFIDKTRPKDEKYIYSEAKGNIDFLKRWTTDREGGTTYVPHDWSIDNDDQKNRSTLCALFEQYVDNTKFTYLTFEDWTFASNGTNGSDYDLNDLAFVVYNVEVEKETPFEYLLCAEDLGATDDFDFNDMIVKVSSMTVGSGNDMKKYLSFTAMAAGGTIPLYLCYTEGGNTTILRPNGVNDPEWHNWFGVSDYTTMINTTNSIPWRQGGIATIEVDKEFSLESFSKIGSTGSVEGISVRVRDKDIPQDVYDPYGGSKYTGIGTLLTNQTERAPQMILIQDKRQISETEFRTWRWPAERKHINEIFRGNNGAIPSFQNWVNNGSAYSNWYLLNATSDVYTGRPE